MADAAGLRRAGVWAMPFASWKRLVGETWREASDDNIGLAAAGVAFYAFLALVPLLGAIVLSYGLIAEPSTVIRNMQQLTTVMPTEAAKLIGDQLMNVVQTSSGKKGVGLIIALMIALFGARNGAAAIVTGLNIAYEEKEHRSFLQLTLIALAMTIAAVVVAVIAMVAVAALGHLETLLPQLPAAAAILGKLVSYFLFALVVAAAAATLYRFGPSRRDARWMWITPGSLFTAISWLILTLGFGAYVAGLGHYEATYGSLGTVMVLLTWLYLSSYVLLLGAELNSAFEHQIGGDSTFKATEAPPQISDTADGGQATAADRDRGVVSPVSTKGGSDAERPPEPLPSDVSDKREALAHYAVGRATARGEQLFGFGKTGIAMSGLAALGLTRIRRGRSALPGMAMLAGAGLLAWLRRAPEKSRSVEAVLFDLDGTLVDSNDLHVRAWREAFAMQGHDLAVDVIHDQIGKGGDFLVPALLPDVTDRERDAISDAHDKLFKKMLPMVRPFPHARDLLEEVHRRGARIVLASSASAAEVDHYVTLLDAAKFIDATTSIDDVDASKPAPDIFLSALAKIGAEPSNAIVIGDTPYDIEAAARSGVSTIALRSGGFEDGQLAGAAALYDGVSAMLAQYDTSPLVRDVAVSASIATEQ